MRCPTKTEVLAVPKSQRWGTFDDLGVKALRLPKAAMLRLGLLSALVAGAAADNCGGSLSADPRYCPNSAINEDGEKYCENTKLLVGDTVPLRVVIANTANFETDDYEALTIYVPGMLQNGKEVQITFACMDDECEKVNGEILSYPPAPPNTPPGTLPGTYAPDVPSTFRMGKAEDGFAGVDYCLRAPDAATACGTLTLTADAEIDAEESIQLGVVYMMAHTYEAESFSVHVSTDSGFMLTTGGYCGQTEQKYGSA